MKRRLCSATIAVLLAALSASGPAHAQPAAPSEPRPGEKTAEKAEAPTGAKAPPKRALPDYGALPEPTTAGDVLLWVPRVLLFPLYLVSEYVVRRPLGYLVPAAERADLPGFLYDVVTFGPDHSAGIAPITLVDFGFRLQIGLYAFWDHAIWERNHMHVHGSTGGTDFYGVAFTDRVTLGDDATVALRLSVLNRPDLVYYGQGPHTLERDQSRYGARTFEGRVLFDTALTDGVRLQAASGVRARDFFSGRFDNDPGLEQRVTSGTFGLPDGFVRGYTAQFNHLSLAFDNRRVRPDPASGVRIEIDGEQGSDLRSRDTSWVRYGASAGGFVDVKNGRVVSLVVSGAAVDPINKHSAVPFTELASLGGGTPLRGYRPGRMLDRTSLAALLRYRYPIWAKLDGSVQLATGSVFGAHWNDFEPRLLRLSGALGIETVGTVDNSFELLVGAGTENFAAGAKIDSFRLVFGTNHGF